MGGELRGPSHAPRSAEAPAYPSRPATGATQRCQREPSPRGLQGQEGAPRSQAQSSRAALTVSPLVAGSTGVVATGDPLLLPAACGTIGELQRAADVRTELPAEGRRRRRQAGTATHLSRRIVGWIVVRRHVRKEFWPTCGSTGRRRHGGTFKLLKVGPGIKAHAHHGAPPDAKRWPTI